MKPLLAAIWRWPWRGLRLCAAWCWARRGWARRELLPLGVAMLVYALGATLIWAICPSGNYPSWYWGWRNPYDQLRIEHALFALGLDILVLYLFLRVWRASARVGHRRGIFTAHLRSAVAVGLPLEEACTHTAGLPRDIATMFAGCGAALREGRSLSRALDSSWACLPPWYAGFLALGERHGRLDVALDALQQADSDEELLRTRSFSAVAYPIFTCIFLGFLLIWIMLLIVPRFMRIYQELGLDLSGAAGRVFRASEWLDVLMQLMPLMALVLLVAAAIPLPDKPLLRQLRTPATVLLMICCAPLLLPIALIAFLPWPWGRHPMRWRFLSRLPRWLAMLREHLPWLGRRHRQAVLVRWARAVGMLLETGCDLPLAMREAEAMADDDAARGRLQRWRQQVEAGRQLDVVLDAESDVPAWFVWQLRCRALGSELPRCLQDAAATLGAQLRRELARSLMLMTPLMILVVAWAVGQLAFGLLQPLCDTIGPSLSRNIVRGTLLKLFSL